MRVGSVTISYNEEDWIEGCLKGLDALDERLVILSDLNFWGETIKQDDRTGKIAGKYADILRVHLKTQEEQRNFALDELTRRGCDYAITIDSDILFEATALQRIVDYVEENKIYRKSGELTRIFTIGSKEFYDNPFRAIQFPYKQIHSPLITDLKSGIRYSHKHRLIIDHDGYIDHIPESVGIFYHFSYVRNNKGLKKKLANSSHRQDGNAEISSFKTKRINLPYEIWRNLPQWCRLLYPHPRKKTP